MKKGQMSFFIVYLIIAVLIVATAAIFKPLGEDATSAFYSSGDALMLSARTTAGEISNATISANLTGVINDARTRNAENQEMAENFFKYSWIIVLLLTSLIIFIFARISGARTQGIIP